MKLLMCDSCDDIFNLSYQLKSCGCGKVKGRYDSNGSTAVVNGEGVSLAMGTGSIMQAKRALDTKPPMGDWRNTVKDVWGRHDHSIICWARPHTGPANSHTVIDPNL